MAAEHSDVRDREERLGAVLVACLEAIDRGQVRSREDLLARYPEFAAELNQFLDDQERVERCAAPLRAVAVAAADGASLPQDGEGTVAEADGSRPAGPLRCLGDHELLEEIGRGGMATVYRARQRGLGRTVAVKVIRAADGASRRDADRFRREAELAAHLDHPHIIPVYEVGEQDGYVYFSMKLIEGGSLADRPDRFTADPRAAARLLTLVARAVHHAHQRGVLHRDLKPANILLDGAGQPHVTDFGLARRVEGDSSLTQSGALLGTPSYMAPEQTSAKRGEVTTAADVYGLGTVLYALLTGRPPFRADTAVDTLLLVREREPEPPRRINARVDRDLETICLKCLEKDPQRRYGSAQAVADDLERWLAGEPISARPVSRRARFWHWCKRNPLVAGLTATLIAVMSLTIIILAVSTVWLWRAQTETEKERDQANDARKGAEARYQYAREVVDEFYMRVAESWLADDPRGQEQRLKFLEKALEFYQQFANEHADDPRARHELARAFGRVGDARKELGHYPEAEQALRRATELFEALLSDEPSRATAASDLALSYHKMGLVLKQTGRAAQAEPYFRKALDQRQKLANEFPERTDYQSGLVFALVGLGDNLRDTGRLAEAEEAYRHATEVKCPPEADAEAARGFRNNHNTSLLSLGTLLADLGRLPEAETFLRRAVAEVEPLSTSQDSSLDDRKWLALCYTNLGYLLNRAHRPGEARDPLSRAAAIRKKLASDFPDVPSYRKDLAATCDNLGNTLHRTGDYRGADEALREAVACGRTLVRGFPAVPDYHSGLGAYLNDMATLRLDQANAAEARQLLEEAISQQQAALKVNGQNPTYQARLRFHYNNLRLALLPLGDHVTAARAAAELAQASPGSWRNVLLAVDILVDCEALALKDETAPKEKRQELYLSYQKRVKEFLRQAVEHHPEDAGAENELARTLVTLRDPALYDPAQAVPLAQRAVERAPQNKVYWNTLGIARYRARDWAGATAALEKSCQLGNGGDGFDWFFLSMVRYQLGDKEEARRSYSRAAAWADQSAPANQELRRFRAEAASLLGIQEQPPTDKEGSPPKK